MTLSAIAIIPSAPVLVPQLAGAAADEIADLRQAVFTVASALPDRWVAVGGGTTDEVLGPAAAGTFAGYGVDVPVVLSPDADDVGEMPEMPLCALIAGWVRGEVRPHARVEVRVFAHGSDANGRELRTELDQTDEPVGVLVVADGANTLTERAPGGYDPASISMQAALDDALATGDVAALAEAPPSITGRAAWQVLAGLAGKGPREAREHYRGAPFGVGYFAGLWIP